LSLNRVAREFVAVVDKQLAERLESIQSILLDVGSSIATPQEGSNEAQLKRAKFDSDNVNDLELWIDEMDAKLPPLRNFILPSGGKGSSFLHVARAVCRRAERSVVPLVESGQNDKSTAIYLNRLSDFLFVAARHMSSIEGLPEVVYKKPKTPKAHS